MVIIIIIYDAKERKQYTNCELRTRNLFYVIYILHKIEHSYSETELQYKQNTVIEKNGVDVDMDNGLVKNEKIIRIMHCICANDTIHRSRYEFARYGSFFLQMINPFALN